MFRKAKTSVARFFVALTLATFTTVMPAMAETPEGASPTQDRTVELGKLDCTVLPESRKNYVVR